MDHFIRDMDKLFINAGVTDDKMKISFFISSIKENNAIDLEKRRRELKTYDAVTEEAINLEDILLKYKIRTTNNINTDKRVAFNLDDDNNSVQNSSNSKFNSGVTEDKGSVTSTLDSLAEIVKGMNQLNINLVQQQQRIQQM